MTHIDQIIADALAGLPETDVAILAREVVRLRESPAVVVPDLDQETQRRIRDEWGEGELRAVLRGYDMARTRARATPADRVLGDGMVGVDARDLDSVISEIDECSKWPHLCENSDIHRHSPAGKRIRALRANQGEVNHD